MIHHFGVPALPASKTTRHHRALRQRVDLPVHALKTGQQQHAALQILRIANGGGIDINVHAGLSKGRQRGGDHHRGRILDQKLTRVHGDAHLLQHIRQTLRREVGGLMVAGAVQPDHQAVADQLVVADAFDETSSFNRAVEVSPGALLRRTGQRTATIIGERIRIRGILKGQQS